MVPGDLISYFTAASAIAGTLTGLLFIAISLRYDAILGKSARFRQRSTAAASFTGLVNAMAISLWALIPGTDLGYVAVVSGAICLTNTVKLHVGRIRHNETQLSVFLLSMSAYLTQLGTGGYLIAQPGSAAGVDVLAYTLFGSFAVSLSRAWQLLQPEDDSPENSASSAAAPGSSAS